MSRLAVMPLLASGLAVLGGCSSGESSGSSGTADLSATKTARTLVHRALRATPTNDLLLDPFVTSDESWGHFLLVRPAAGATPASGRCPLPVREVLSASPGGVAGSSVLLGPRTNPVADGCVVLLAPLTGSTGLVRGQLWISLDDANGTPVALPAAGLASTLTASLVANALPSQGASQSYPLTLTGAPTTVNGRTWGRLATSGTVSLPEGGWLTVTVVDPTAALHLSSPSVAPVTVSDDLAATARASAATASEQGATAGYAVSVQTRPPAPSVTSPVVQQGR